ncbi:hypothetical protein [Rubrivirga sp.]|uniref:hypothetical protein n=1 Tax=Rubrivirga sp. TaxID=1885344 RepID=UPI003B52F148
MPALSTGLAAFSHMPSAHLNDLSPTSDLTLWTGGWDSTYRVLQRARIERRPVRPCYVVDRNRASAGMELDAMNRLLNTLQQQDPETFARFWAPRYVDRQAIPANPSIERAWEHLRDAYDIGNQYNWLARLVEAADWTGVELSVYGGGRLRPMFGDHVHAVEQEGGHTTYVVGPDAPEPVRLVFGRFAFPFWETDKQSAFAAADRQGLTELLDAHTWFCFDPRNGEPCGLCRPCEFMMKDGLGHRIPRSGHLRHRLRELRIRAGLRPGVKTRLLKLVGR